MKKFWMITLLVLIAFVAAPLLAQDGFRPLFNGENLDGWVKQGGGATYAAEDGCIVGRVGPGPNTFLCTEKEYGDFVLRLKLKLDDPSNSGVQFRSHTRPTTWDGNDIQRVFGYQCEVDPSDRAWSGGIYDESRRGWIFNLAGDEREESRGAFKVDGWNEYVIQAIGPSIKTWVNGVPCTDLIDTADLSGLIALQVHSANHPGQIRWKDIEILDLGVNSWTPLFDGETVDGWRSVGGGTWTVDEGTLHGTSPASESTHGILISDMPVKDFVLQLEFKADKGNSGLYFRVEEVDHPVSVKGFQAEIADQDDIGGLYETLGRAWVVQPSAEQVETYFKPGDWNTMIVIAAEDGVRVVVNGVTTVVLEDDPGLREGLLGLQLHGGQDMDVRFRNIELLELSPEAAELILR